MSLTPRTWFLSLFPYKNKRLTRFKELIAYRFVNEKQEPTFNTLSSPVYHQIWKVGEWYTAFDQDGDDAAKPYDAGFHVYLNFPSKRIVTDDCAEEVVIVELEVKGFIASGWYVCIGGTKVKSETWKQARIVRVLTLAEKDITEEFKKTQ